MTIAIPRRQPFLVLIAACLYAALPVPGALAQDYGAILAAPDRSAEDRKTDERRKPAPFLAFTGVRPGMRVLDMAAGGGYTTELLARAVAPGGVVFAQGTAPRARERIEARLKNAPKLRIEPLIQPFDAPMPPEARDLDLVTLIFNYHDTVHLGVDRAAMNRNILAALKPGGAFVLADHAAKAGDGASVAGTLHRIEEATLRSEIEAAGFKLVAQGDFLRNPDDKRDTPSGNAPESTDRFVLRFEKPR